jgi:hypothetical protein
LSVPEAAFGNRSALEWVIVIAQVIHVSIETQRLIHNLPDLP